jgi:hypothetical protein
MRQVIYRSVIALASGALRIVWADLFDSAEREADARGLFSADGLRMKPSYAAYRNAAERLWPFERITVLEEGPDVWAYRFHQPGGQTTTVVWSSDTVHEWKIEGAPSSFRIVDVGGSLAHNANSVPLSPDPLYIVEHSNGEARKFPAHGNMITPNKQPFVPRAFCFPESSGEVMLQDGWDWSLPERVTPEIYSGFFNFAERPSQQIRIIGWHPKWADWHIAPGRYDFSSLERKLDEAHAGNFRIGIRLQSVVKPNVPEWVIAHYQPPETKLGGRFAPTIVAPWHADVRKQFEEFIAELGSRGFHRDPAFVFASIHGISQSTGEEFSLPPLDIRHLEQTTGLTPQSMREWILGRISAWGSAFGDQAYKLAWVGNSGAFAGEYSKVAGEAVELALSLGMGTRGGFIEMYNYMWNERAVGQYRSQDGYLMTDEQFPAIVNGSFFADENEEYITVKRWRFGRLEEDEHRWRISTLRALQMRRNFLATYPMAMDIDRHLTEYTRLSMGKTIDNTPDAWSYLREAYVRETQGKALPLKNMERWLFQRDLPGGMTQPAVRVERSYALTTDPDGIRHEYAARRTDRATGNDYIYFRLHDSFIVQGVQAAQASQSPVVLKITYLDQSEANWTVEYASGSGNGLHRTAAVHNSNDGQIKTATFLIRDADFAGSQLTDGQHFRIYNGGQADVTIAFVRVIRL